MGMKLSNFHRLVLLPLQMTQGLLTARYVSGKKPGDSSGLLLDADTMATSSIESYKDRVGEEKLPAFESSKGAEKGDV